MKTENQQEVSPFVRWFVMMVDRMVILVSAHWLAMVTVLLAVFCGLPVLAPVLMHMGWTAPAELIYAAYHFTCHELAYRSFFLYGAQSAYPLDQLSALFGAPGYDLIYWGGFTGDAQLGYKMAWCERDAAIYGSMLVGGLVYGLLRFRLPRLDWRVYLLMVVPMAIDGFWQLFTSPVYFLPFLPEHESTWGLRVFTGVLFGVGSIWLVYPKVEQATREIYAQAQEQLAHALSHPSQ